MRNARLAAIYGLVVMVIVVMTGVTYGMKTPQTKTPQKNPLVKGTLNAQKKETRVGLRDDFVKVRAWVA